MHKELVVFCLC